MSLSKPVSMFKCILLLIFKISEENDDIDLDDY